MLHRSIAPAAWLDAPLQRPAVADHNLRAREGGDMGTDDMDATEKLSALRAELERRGLDGFIVPMADEYQDEYVPAYAKRIEWLTGFTGSAALAIVLRDRAAVFTDGRYTLQIREQVDDALYELRHIGEEPPTDWLTEHVGEGMRIGYDAWLFSESGIARFRTAIEAAKAELAAVATNPVDTVWTDQPERPTAPVVPHDIAYAGESAADKRARLAAALRKERRDAAVITAPDSIAWLLNVRGGDVEHSPLPLSFAILFDDGRCDLFLDRRKISDGLQAHLGNEVALKSDGEFAAALDALGEAKASTQVDPAMTAAWVFERLAGAGAKIVRAADPCQLPKALKNDVELAGTRAAHRRDGVAVSRFLHWLADSAADGSVDEMAAESRLEDFRREGELFRDLSFPTITGAGPNGAIVHYRVTPNSNRALEPGMLYLVDSGAQYLDGTTDITRTVAIGTPSAEMRERFTLVLKGHIALATCRFPKGTTGGQIDALARQYLWRAGLDFDHGTGHGVGSYLNVHEGPQRISKLGTGQALEPGMIVSNEPGYYKTGAYGIRIENLVAVCPANGIEDAEREIYEFETLTRAPIDLNLVERALMTDDEVAWLNGYHAEVRAAVGAELDGPAADWLEQATRVL